MLIVFNLTGCAIYTLLIVVLTDASNASVQSVLLYINHVISKCNY